MPVGARNLELAMATVCCVLRPGFPSGGDRPLVGCAVGGAGDLPPRCGARCQLRRVHCWLAPPLHAQRMIFVPFAVAPPVASRHSPDCTPVMVPLALRFHCWLAVPRRTVRRSSSGRATVAPTSSGPCAADTGHHTAVGGHPHRPPRTPPTVGLHRWGTPAAARSTPSPWPAPGSGRRPASVTSRALVTLPAPSVGVCRERTDAPAVGSGRAPAHQYV